MIRLPHSPTRSARWTFAGLLLAVALLSGCGGSGSSVNSGPDPTTPTNPSTPTAPATPVAPLMSANDAARLLDQATFGVTAGDVAHLQSIGISAYLDEQLAAPLTQYSGYSYTPHTAPSNCVTDPATRTDASSLCARDQYTPFRVQRDFFTHALNGADQLRQRVAYALSQ